jgi:hypothetical protein
MQHPSDTVLGRVSRQMDSRLPLLSTLQPVATPSAGYFMNALSVSHAKAPSAMLFCSVSHSLATAVPIPVSLVFF